MPNTIPLLKLFNCEVRKELRKLRKAAEKYKKQAVRYQKVYDLCGLCAISAASIVDRLGNKIPIKPAFTDKGHACCVVNDIIVDLTATQFDEKKKYIFRRIPLKKDWWIMPWYHTDLKVCDNLNHFFNELSNWDRDHPKHYKELLKLA